jgi:L-threonylcarbamoyladenylate synthase
MRVISAQALEQGAASYEEIAEVLRNDGLICFPSRRQYSIGAALMSEAAVLRLVQSKRRSEKAPSLVLIPDRKALEGLIESMPASAAPLMDSFWPGQLTMCFAPNPELPAKVLKTITQKRMGKIGVRVPSPGIPLQIVKAFGGPILTSSANLSRKTGSSSVANIRKSFANCVEILIDAGDLAAEPPSTVVDLAGECPQLVREGGIRTDEIQAVLRDSGMILLP